MSIWSDRPFLELCQRLKERGLTPRFEEGDRIARGFADLGFEEFCMLPGGRTVSLYNGKVSPLPDDHRHFFFLVPSIEQLLGELSARGICGNSFEYLHQRTWKVMLSCSDRSWVATGDTLEMTVATGLLSFFEGADR